MKDAVVLNTSVLVNFPRIDCMDLIRGHPCDFMVTGQVLDEVTDNCPTYSYDIIRYYRR